MAETLLSLSGIGVPPYSARGLKERLEPITEIQQPRRTVNGALLSVAPSQFKKYKLTITAEDINPPAIPWPGYVIVTVDAVSEIPYLTATGSPERSVVPGSSRVEGDYTFYRPVLEMQVFNFSVERDEYGAAVSWTLDLEEV